VLVDLVYLRVSQINNCAYFPVGAGCAASRSAARGGGWAREARNHADHKQQGRARDFSGQRSVAMRVLIAGATGAIGRPLVGCLREQGHAVFAFARSTPSSRALADFGAEPVTADALDAAAVKTAIGRIRPEAVINETIGNECFDGSSAVPRCTFRPLLGQRKTTGSPTASPIMAELNEPLNC
jgi:NADPH:quinone reductase-like Zn-dependent oxidoreductase